MKEKVSFHHFKGIGTLCVISLEGSEIGRFGLALQHGSDKIFNRPLGRKISEGRARKLRGDNNSGIRPMSELKKIIAHLREEMPVSLGRQEKPRNRAMSPERENYIIQELKLDLLHSLVYRE